MASAPAAASANAAANVATDHATDAAAAAAAAAGEQRPPLREFKETLLFLQTNDFHSQMDPLPPRVAPPRKALGGLARIQTYFDSPDGRAGRHGPESVVVLDCGDVFQGGPFYTFFGGEVDMAALVRRRCAAMAVGNHDFDGGLDELRKHAAEQAPDMALLCANLVDAEGNLAFQPHVMLRAGRGPPGRQPPGWRVGVTGIMGQNAWDVVFAGLRGGLRLTNPLAAAQRAAHELVAAGAEVLVCLSHTGLSARGPANDMDLAKLQLFDVLFSGHDHNEADVLDDAPPGFRVGRTLVHQGVSSGRAVVWAEVTMRAGSGDTGTGSDGADGGNHECPAVVGHVVDCQGGSDPIDDRYADDPATVAWLDEYRCKPILPACPNGFAAQLVRPLGCACPTGYHVERKEASLLPAYPCKMAEWLMKGCDADGVQLACINVGGIRSSLPATDNLTWGDVQAAWPWKSPPARCDISATLLVHMLRLNVALMAAGRATGTFLAFTGLWYEAVAESYGDPQLSCAKLVGEAATDSPPFFELHPAVTPSAPVAATADDTAAPAPALAPTAAAATGAQPAGSSLATRFFVLVGPRFVVEHHLKQQAERAGLVFKDHVRARARGGVDLADHQSLPVRGIAPTPGPGSLRDAIVRGITRSGGMA